MQPDFLFLLINYGILLPWTLLIVAPRWSVTRRATSSAVFPVVLGLGYAAVFTLAPTPPTGGDLETIRTFLGSPWGATIMWIHAVAFDLFVGAWIVRDAQRRSIPHLAVVPCLLGTLMLGPVGLLAFLGLRAVRRTGTGLHES
ncbi:MAG: DUF4281 domain-containing protein [Deltaproteobacteria bacterium]|nr:DUF4281 domain-containing protein [Deltaproteobacteria bacterium]